METVLVYEGNFWLLAIKGLCKLDNWTMKVTSWSKYLQILPTTQQCPQIIQNVSRKRYKRLCRANSISLFGIAFTSTNDTQISHCKLQHLREICTPELAGGEQTI